jgi:hypothetical protein
MARGALITLLGKKYLEPISKISDHHLFAACEPKLYRRKTNSLYLGSSHRRSSTSNSNLST